MFSTYVVLKYVEVGSHHYSLENKVCLLHIAHINLKIRL